MSARKVFYILSVISLIVTSLVFSGFEQNVSAQQRGERLKKILERRRDEAKSDKEIKGEIAIDGRRRSYLIHLPPGYDKNKKMPMVLAFHGGGGNAENMRQMSGFNQKADSENFIVVYPNGLGRLNNILLTWNAVGCCDYAMEQKIDDVKFIGALIDKLVLEYGIDSKRIYATGFSNGALISYRLAAEMPEKFAAIAPVAGALFENSPKPKGRVPVLIIHGLADTAVPYEGGYSQRDLVAKRQSQPFKSLGYAAEVWAKTNGCSALPKKETKGAVIRESHPSCVDNNNVEVIAITDGLHAWPGGNKGRDAADAPSTAISATDEIWEFFKKHRRK